MLKNAFEHQILFRIALPGGKFLVGSWLNDDEGNPHVKQQETNNAPQFCQPGHALVRAVGIALNDGK